MTIMKRLLILLVLCGCSDAAVARKDPDDPDTRTKAAAVLELQDEIDAGRVGLVDAWGNGSSSGASITGSIINRSTSEIRVAVRLRRPMYLANSGRGQNMIALQVYLSDRSYFRGETEDFISLPPGATTKVIFIAFCMDFDKDNPTADESFRVSSPLSGIPTVVRRGEEYLAANHESDPIAAVQAAIWLAQGVELADIRTRFPLTAADESVAMSLIR